MKVMTLKMKFAGKVENIFQVVDATGEVLYVACSKEEAEEWISKQ